MYDIYRYLCMCVTDIRRWRNTFRYCDFHSSTCYGWRFCCCLSSSWLLLCYLIACLSVCCWPFRCLFVHMWTCVCVYVLPVALWPFAGAALPAKLFGFKSVSIRTRSLSQRHRNRAVVVYACGKTITATTK